MIISPFNFFHPKDPKYVVEKEKLAVLIQDYIANLNQFENCILSSNTESHLPLLKR